MSKPKILMLGWEFPPVISGGLGIACLGLTKAIAPHTDLSVIIPRSDPEFIPEQIELIGLNNFDLQNLKKIKSSEFYKEFADVKEVEANINPYYTSHIKYDILTDTNKKELKVTDQFNPFQIGDLYGDDLISKVIEYAKYTARLAYHLEFDLIHCHDWMTFLAGVEIKALTGKPLVLHVHSLEFDRSGANNHNWVYQLEQWAMNYADAVIPVSQYTGKVAEDHYGINPDKIFPVHNGIELSFSHKESKHFPEKLVLFLGRITGQKGPSMFLEMATKIIQQIPDVRFVMAGTGDQLRELIETSAFRNLGHRFHFTGFLNKQKVDQILSMADVYCMPSVSEPFGLSALEAVQHGIPCVLSKQSGVAEVLKNTLQADYWDIDKMAGHVIALLKDETLKDTVVANAYEDLKACTWEKAAEKTLDIYKKLIHPN